MARSAGDLRRALTEIEQFRIEPLRPGMREMARVGARERFLRAELLQALGRDDEALPWYESLDQWQDLPYLAPASLRLAEIYERQGASNRSRFYYNCVVGLWRDADAELQPLLARAQSGLRRLNSGLAARPPAVPGSTRQ